VRQQGEKARIEREVLDGARARDDLARVATKSQSVAFIGQRSQFDHLAVLRARRSILRNRASRSPMDAADRRRRLEVILINGRQRGWTVSGARSSRLENVRCGGHLPAAS
jgi:hypothetical protein